MSEEEFVQKEYNISDFVDSVIQRIEKDTGFRARMRRADNPLTAEEAWSYLIKLGNVDLKNDIQRFGFGLVGAAIARDRVKENGTQTLGRALNFCRESMTEEDASVERLLRRVLACRDALELIPILRRVVVYIQKNEKTALDYKQLLKDILYFGENVKLRWAKDYYSFGKFDVEEAGNAENAKISGEKVEG
ncbi:MAG: type I-E CRISPR-associated protein Cse2/CasB [Planctomycetia bacterium]|nr:type I-E CRISPR-associated protein Cse2/CasB [Planctomycetia bacterium]